MATVAAMAWVFTSCKEDVVDITAPDGKVSAAAVIDINPGGARASVFNITASTTWSNTNTYVLNGYVRVVAPAVLTIQAGTTILGDKASVGTLIIEQGAQLIAQGTACSPIVFTSEEVAPNRRPGDWGGLIINGKSQVNIYGQGNTTTGLPALPSPTTTNRVEGIIPSADVTANPSIGVFGANPAVLNDNSGTLQYLRIEYAGISTTTNNETNGLTLGAVGSGTTIDHVEVAFGNDDGFEWFGGTVNAKYLISYRNRDDDFDTDFGYQGTLQFLYALRDPAIGDNDKANYDGSNSPGSGSNAFESDNNASTVLAANTAMPRTLPRVFNATVVGPDNRNAANPTVQATSSPITIGTYSFGYAGYGGGGNGVLNRRNTLENINNSVIVGWPKAGYEYTTGSAAGSPASSTLFSTVGTVSDASNLTTAAGNVISYRTTAGLLPNTQVPNRVCSNPAAIVTPFATAALSNLCRGAADLGIDLNVNSSFWSLSAPNPRPIAGSVLLTGAVAPVSAPASGYTPVTFRGAFTDDAFVGSDAGKYASINGWNITSTTCWAKYFNYGN